MKEIERGTKMHCHYCDEIQECKAVPPSSIGLESAQRWKRTDHTDIQWFRRVRKCLKCENIFITAELDQNFLEELVALRDALSDIKVNAEKYQKESATASKSLAKLSESLSVLRALDLYKQAPISMDEIFDEVNSTAAEQRAARLVFAGGAFTPPLTKGMLRPFGNPSAMTDSSPPQAGGHSQVSS